MGHDTANIKINLQNTNLPQKLFYIPAPVLAAAALLRPSAQI